MDCHNIKRWLNRYMDKEVINSDEITKIQTHLNECIYCRRELAALEVVKGLIQQKEKITVKEDFAVNLQDRLGTQPQATIVKWLPEAGDWSRRLIPLPIAVLGLLFLLLFAGVNGRSPVEEYIYADLSNEELAIVNGYITNSDLLQSVMDIN